MPRERRRAFSALVAMAIGFMRANDRVERPATTTVPRPDAPRCSAVRSNVLLGISFLQVIWRDACAFGNSSEHLWADLVSMLHRGMRKRGLDNRVG
jgi:hypothetical protein